MNITIDNILLIGSLLLFLSIVAGKTSQRFGVPTLILFLVVGMLAGSDGLAGIEFNDPSVAKFIGIVALNFILFSGGLDTQWSTVRPVLWQGLSLSTAGVILTALLVGLFVWYVTDFTIYESMLLGSIVSSTDAAAVFSILRSKSLALKSRLRPLLELESGSNDPMAYVLTIAFLGLVVNQDRELIEVLPLLLQQMVFGAITGILFGLLSKQVINRIRLNYEALYPLLTIALMFITFSATEFLNGNGFLAVYICAIYLGNQDIIHKKTILKMYDGFAWLMQIVLFITLGLLVNPRDIIPVIGTGLLVSGFLMLVARPVSVWISLSPFRMKARQRFFISWVGLRGAVPIVFATFPLLAGIDQAGMIFNIVFFVTLTSVLIQGTSLLRVAKWLHVALPEKVKRISPLDAFMSDYPKPFMKEFMIAEACPVAGRKIVDISFPRSAIIAMIHRSGKYFTPNGATVIEAGDILIVLSDSTQGIDEVNQLIGECGPGSPPDRTESVKKS